MTTKNKTADEQALLNAIIQHPEEDTPRLAYADLLDEIGGEENRARAELIRIQCDPARLRSRWVWGADTNRREDELFRRYGHRWIAQAGLKNTGACFERGFVHEIRVLPQKFERAVQKASAPLREVWFTRRGHFGESFTSEQLRTAAASPHLRRFKSVSVYKTRIGIDGWEALASSPHLAGLDLLDLGRTCTATQAALRVLSNTSAFAGLRALGLECWTMRVESSVQRREYLNALARMENFHGLEGIDLSNVQSRQAAGVVVTAGWRLKELFLCDNDLRQREVAALAESDHLAGLVALNLIGNRVGDGGATAIARSRVLTGLRVLNLHSNRIGDRGAIALADSAGLEGIRRLDLSRNPISSKGIKALRARFGNQVRLSTTVDTPSGD